MMSLPSIQLRRNRLFYLRYDAFYVVLSLAALLVMRLAHHSPLVDHWDARLLLLLPLVCHAQILCSVYIHNSTHQNFPRALNRVIGEVCGLVVISRFASWEIIHRRHHRYSDDTDRDPHPVVASYWAFLLRTLVGVERQLQRVFFELHGESTENRRYERRRAYLSYATSLLLILCWYTLLGWVVFVTLFLPASIVGLLHLVHFNWSTHNGFSPNREFMPVNLNHGLFRLGNLLWHGIYMHANHHKRTNAFNPARIRIGQGVRQLVSSHPRCATRARKFCTSPSTASPS